MPFYYIMKWLKKIFDIKEEKKDSVPKIIEKPKNLKTISQIKQFDDVWIRIDGVIYEGWVTENKENIVYIVYTDNNNKLQDAVFKIERPLTRTTIENNNKLLILNESEAV